MPTYTNPLERVKVAAPCPADWSKMVGDERMRYCERCSLHVYNLSGMTRCEAEALVTNSEGRLCVRYYRRGDGTIITRNCPVGLSALKRRAAHAATATMTAVLGFFAALGLNLGVERAFAPSVMEESAVPAPLVPDVTVPPAPLEEVPAVGWLQGDISAEGVKMIVGRMTLNVDKFAAGRDVPGTREQGRRRK
ncbi:MAG TPA: hypothetical protein VF297_15200 [Pyrinomonadaceae bacterium]